MHWFFKFLALVFVVFLVGYNLSFADSAFLTLDVAGTIGYIMAVMVVLVAVVRAGLGSVVAGTLGTQAPVVVSETDAVRYRRDVAGRYKPVPVREEVIVYENAPVIGESRAYTHNKRARSGLQTRGLARTKTRCACGMPANDRCMCDLQKRADRGTRSPFAPAPHAQARGIIRPLEYTLILTNEVATRPTLASTIEVEGACPDISADIVYGACSSTVLANMPCRPIRLRINNVPTPVWFDLPYSDTNRDMRVIVREDSRGIYILRDSAEPQYFSA
jgi:hypothetical protein